MGATVPILITVDGNVGQS